MDNHSRSASPRENSRPQHRPPSPPSPPAFENRAYLHDEADQNHNDSFTSTQQNGHSKEPNGGAKTLEAVNLELINLTPKNGHTKKDVEVEINASNPYEEYFVPVNEHRKYMRGEKLYVTADKRGEKGKCKRPLCWTLLALVVAAVVALIVLAATGVLFTNSPTEVEQYNSSVSSARAFGGLGSVTVHDHNHDHSDHDHSDHDHNQHDHTIEATHETQSDQSTGLSGEASMYVPRTLEGEIKIDNKEFTDELNDPNSDEYHQLSAEISRNLKNVLENAMSEKNAMENVSDFNVEVVQLRKGSVLVTFRVHWTMNNNSMTSQDPLTPSTLKSELQNYLEGNYRMISSYSIAENYIKTSKVVDLCLTDLNGCEYGCTFDNITLNFVCTCPEDQTVDRNDPKKCVYENQIHKEYRGLDFGTVEKNIEGDKHSNAFDWTGVPHVQQETTTESNTNFHNSHIFGHPQTTLQPNAEPEPTAEPKAEPGPTAEPKIEPEPTAEPKAEPEPTAEPKAEPEPTADPKAEPEPTAEPKAEPEPTAEPKAEPEPTAEPKAEQEPTAEPKPEPEPTSEPNAEPEPTTEPKVEPVITAESKAELEPTFEPKSEPEPTAEPKAESEPKAEPESTAEPKAEPEPKAVPEPTAELKAEPEPTTEPKAEPEPTTDPKAEPEPTAEPLKPTSEPEAKIEPTSEPNAEPEPIAEPKAEPEITAESKAEPEPTAEPKAEPDPAAEPKPEPTTDSKTEPGTMTEATVENKAITDSTEKTKSEVEPFASLNTDLESTAKPKLESETTTELHIGLELSSEPSPQLVQGLIKESNTQAANMTDSNAESDQKLYSEPKEQPTTSKPSFELIVTHELTTSKSNLIAESTTKPEADLNIENAITSKSVFLAETTTKTEPTIEPVPMTNPTVKSIGLESVPEMKSEEKQNISTPFLIQPIEELSTIESGSASESSVPVSEFTNKPDTKQTTESKPLENNVEMFSPKYSISYSTRASSENQPNNDHVSNIENDQELNTITTTESEWIQDMAQNENLTHMEQAGQNVKTNEQSTMPERTKNYSEDVNLQSHDITTSTEKLDDNTIDQIKSNNTGEGRAFNFDEIPTVEVASTAELEQPTEQFFNSEDIHKVIQTNTDNHNTDNEILAVSTSKSKEDNSTVFINRNEPTTTVSDWLSVSNNQPTTNMNVEKETDIPKTNDIQQTNTDINEELKVDSASEKTINDITTVSNETPVSTELLPSPKPAELTTVTEYIYKQATTTEAVAASNITIAVNPAPVWEEEYNESSVKVPQPENTSSENTVQMIKNVADIIPQQDVVMTTTENYENEKSNVAQVNNLNVTIYEKPPSNLVNGTFETETQKPIVHSAEYVDHDKEPNPYLPEVENNNILLKTLQEGHDLENLNMNETQNDTNDEHSLSSISESPSNTMAESNAMLKNATETSSSGNKLLEENIQDTTTVKIEEKSLDVLPVSTFLADTADLDVTKGYKSVTVVTTMSTIPEEQTEPKPTTNSETLNVVPIMETRLEEKQVLKKNYKSDNSIQDFNDISDAPKKSDKRTFDVDKVDSVINNEA